MTIIKVKFIEDKPPRYVTFGPAWTLNRKHALKFRTQTEAEAFITKLPAFNFANYIIEQD